MGYNILFKKYIESEKHMIFFLTIFYFYLYLFPHS